MSGAVTWELLMFIGTIVLTTSTIAFWFFKLIAGAKRDASDAVAKVEEQLATHKLYAANNYVTRDNLREEMRALRESLDNLSARIDRVLDK